MMLMQKIFPQRNGQRNILHRKMVSMWNLQLHTDIAVKKEMEFIS